MADQNFHSVNTPDGKTINFPMSMSDSDINGAMQKMYPSQQQASNPPIDQAVVQQKGQELAHEQDPGLRLRDRIGQYWDWANKNILDVSMFQPIKGQLDAEKQAG